MTYVELVKSKSSSLPESTRRRIFSTQSIGTVLMVMAHRGSVVDDGCWVAHRAEDPMDFDWFSIALEQLN